MLKRLIPLLPLILSASANAQAPLPPEEIPFVNHLIDSSIEQKSLKCEVRPFNPSLDFRFRYETGFVVSTGLMPFSPGENFVAYLRVTPQGGAPVFLRSTFEIPKVQQDAVRNANPKDLRKSQLNLSGAFNVGQGRYAVELLLLRGHRSCYSRWHLRTGKYSSDAVPLNLDPESVMPLVPESWDGKLDAKGLRLTVLLDAAPMDPYAAQLRPWDRAFLLQSLAALLQQVRCQSVQLVAFNLDHQCVVFRQESFDGPGFDRLGKVLEQLDPATISYQALQRGNWLKFLLWLAREQTSVKDPSDAIVFLGPISHFDQKVFMEPPQPPGSRFFYFEFCRLAPHFPDSIEYLTRNLHGSVFLISSATDFAQAIQKMLGQVRPTQNGSHPPGPQGAAASAHPAGE
jgi:hypothetical protein